jgi:dethiobiotin synthetase
MMKSPRTVAKAVTELDGSLVVVSAGRLGAIDEVVLEAGVLAEAEVHVGLSAGQRRVFSDDLLEA